MRRDKGYYILLLSVHGLIRGDELELGRDSDTGGQTKYVVELARALESDPRVEKVDLITRLIEGKGVDDDYAVPHEPLGEKSSIIRIPFGPRRYLRKEKLWPYVNELFDGTIQYLRKGGRTPDAIHGHYADAALVGSSLAKIFGCPFIFTGHSLGRVKRERLLEKGMSDETLEQRFYFTSRCEAEEVALDNASFVVASTRQEIEEQYALYDHYEPTRMRVIPPGVDLNRFREPVPDAPLPPYFQELRRFLRDPEKPMILAIARPDERKNLTSLVSAYGKNSALREMANLVVVAGNREKFEDLSASARKVIRQLILLIDNHDLYGSVAYPKHHTPDDVPDLYTLAARLKGIFVNPALTEPFGLTLLEAAASGLPVVATNDGGPRDILEACQHGLLVDPYDEDDISSKLQEALADQERYEQWASSARELAFQHFTWERHVERYVDEIDQLEFSSAQPIRGLMAMTKLTTFDRLLVTHIRGIFSEGDEASRKELFHLLKENRSLVGLCVSTRLSFDGALEKITNLKAPQPDFLIASSGAEVFTGPQLVKDLAWEKHISYKWEPDRIREVLGEVEDLDLEEEEEQRKFRITYRLQEGSAVTKNDLMKRLRNNNIRANVVYSYGSLFDILPIRATTGLALRQLALKWGVPDESILVIRYPTGDESMFFGNNPGVVLGQKEIPVEELRENPRIISSERTGAAGVLEGLRHFQFFDDEMRPLQETA